MLECSDVGYTVWGSGLCAGGRVPGVRQFEGPGSSVQVILVKGFIGSIELGADGFGLIDYRVCRGISVLAVFELADLVSGMFLERKYQAHRRSSPEAAYHYFRSRQPQMTEAALVAHFAYGTTPRSNCPTQSAIVLHWKPKSCDFVFLRRFRILEAGLGRAVG